jgi:hypothetical protein
MADMVIFMNPGRNTPCAMARISITYEGTNDVEALNLRDRKILLDQDAELRQRSKHIKGFIDVHKKKATRR